MQKADRESVSDGQQECPKLSMNLRLLELKKTPLVGNLTQRRNTSKIKQIDARVYEERKMEAE